MQYIRSQLPNEEIFIKIIAWNPSDKNMIVKCTYKSSCRDITK